MTNLLRNIPNELPTELFETLAQTGSTHIERIVSKGHSTRGGEWYDQDRNEFVLLLKGAARLEFADGGETEMGPGDCLEIPAHRRHRVAWTRPEAETIWLAIHYL